MSLFTEGVVKIAFELVQAGCQLRSKLSNAGLHKEYDITDNGIRYRGYVSVSPTSYQIKGKQVYRVAVNSQGRLNDTLEQMMLQELRAALSKLPTEVSPFQVTSKNMFGLEYITK